jgi:hypothetical protein
MNHYNNFHEGHHKKVTKRLLDTIPKQEIEKVWNQYGAMLEYDFIGFVSTYECLSHLIPDEWTIVDLGCSYNAQAYLFPNHKKIVSVDAKEVVSKPDGTLHHVDKRFCPPNCVVLEMLIEDFFNHEEYKCLDLKKTFAICNYVPDKDVSVSVRVHFDNVYVFYP